MTLPCRLASAEGVTIITHGWNSDAGGWVTAMGQAIAARLAVSGSEATLYSVRMSRSGSGAITATLGPRTGPSPLSSDCGEIVILLDWSSLGSYPIGATGTGAIARSLAEILRSTTFLPDLQGHALAEQPLHGIGHSRGASLMCELAKALGDKGILVDHLTTLDPHPVSGDGPWLSMKISCLPTMSGAATADC
jgi:hypothetical protein